MQYIKSGALPSSTLSTTADTYHVVKCYRVDEEYHGHHSQKYSTVEAPKGPRRGHAQVQGNIAEVVI